MVTFTNKAMIGLVVEEAVIKGTKALYFGPYDDRLAARKALDEIAASPLVIEQGRVVHRTIFNIAVPA